MKKLSTITIILSVLIFFKIMASYVGGAVSTNTKCYSCHQDIYEKIQMSRYQHPPAMSDCTSCHRKDEEQDYTQDDYVIDTEIPLKKFIIKTSEIDFKKKYKAQILLRDEDENESEPYEFEIIPEKAENFTKRFKDNIKLSNIRIEEIRKGVFLGAVIAWQTDGPATTGIQYWKVSAKKKAFKINYPEIYSWEHRIELSGLKRDKKYEFSVVSEGIKGNRVMSRRYRLDVNTKTKKKIDKRNKKDENKEEEDNEEAPEIKKIKIFKIDDEDSIYILIESSRPVYCTLTLHEETATNEENDHFYRVDRYASIDACNDCHEFTVSHPVGIRAESEHVHVPESLFTIDDGIITCATCHYPHGANMPYLARFDFKEDLCLKCHDKTIYER